jgi:hypothetical protein
METRTSCALGVGGIIALACLGCGGDSGDDGGAVPLDGVPAALGKSFCQKVQTCCSAAEREANPLAGGDVATCQARVTALLAVVFPDVKESVTRGRATYHGDRMAACLASLDSQSCDQARPTNVTANIMGACTGAFEPRVPPGGDCGDNGDCATGFCDGPPVPGLGKCVDRKEDGGPCLNDEECLAGACLAGACAAPIVGGGGDALCK